MDVTLRKVGYNIWAFRNSAVCGIISALSFWWHGTSCISLISDRWVHPGSGRIYNLVFSPPKVEGKDDETGEDLIQREDDKPESVRNRLEVFSKNTKPVLDFYREQGVLADFHGTESKKIWPHVEAHIKGLVNWTVKTTPTWPKRLQDNMKLQQQSWNGAGDRVSLHLQDVWNKSRKLLRFTYLP